MWDLVPWPGIEPGPPALGAQSLSHWTARETPVVDFYCVLPVCTELSRNILHLSSPQTVKADGIRSMCWCLVSKSCLTLCNPVDWAQQAPLSVGFSRQEYWSGLPFPPPGDLPDSGIEAVSPALVGRFFTTELPGIRLGPLKWSLETIMVPVSRIKTTLNYKESQQCFTFSQDIGHDSS